MKMELNEMDLEQVIGGLSFSRTSPTTGWITYNGQKYPFTDYNACLATAQQCVNSGITSDEGIFNALKAAGLI